MKILTPEEMRRCDEYTIKNIGIGSNVLMERAGHSVVRTILEEKKFGNPKVRIPRVLILCGNGNNGGDGLVIARELNDLGYEVEVCMMMGISGLSKNSARNLEILTGYGVGVSSNNYSTICEVSQKLELSYYHIVIDAIFGTGQNRNVPEYIDEMMLKINRSKSWKVAVDVPTGINCQNGELLADDPFKADLTVSFAFPKIGSLLYPAREFIGKLRIAYIGIKNNTPQVIGWNPKYLMNVETASKYMPRRNPGGHKGSFGKTIVVGGCSKYRGAPVLASKAAFETGCGMVHMVSPNAETEPFSFPELIRHHVGNDYKGYLSMKDIDDILPLTKDMDVMVLGPGIGRAYSTSMMVMELIRKTELPMILDADALYALSLDLGKIDRNRMKNIILTPHMKEFSRLCNIPMDKLMKNYLDTGVEFARETGAVLVLKSATTVIFTPDGELILNTSGNSGQAKAGSGDVLAGVIGGFVSQGCSCLRAAQLGVFAAGLSADIYTLNNQEYTLTPSKVIDNLQAAFNHISDSGKK